MRAFGVDVQMLVNLDHIHGVGVGIRMRAVYILIYALRINVGVLRIERGTSTAKHSIPPIGTRS